MSSRKIIKIVNDAFNTYSDKHIYSSITKFAVLSKEITSFIEHNIKIGSIFHDIGRSQYGQIRPYYKESMFIIKRTTPKYVHVISDLGEKYKLRARTYTYHHAIFTIAPLIFSSYEFMITRLHS